MFKILKIFQRGPTLEERKDFISHIGDEMQKNNINFYRDGDVMVCAGQIAGRSLEDKIQNFCKRIEINGGD